MQFLHPAFLWLLVLGIIPVVLYLVRRRSKKVRVSTLVFFKTLAQEHQESAWLRRLKRWLSLAMTLLMLVLAVFVLARLIVRPDQQDAYRTIVILLDRSASMAVRDAGGRSRLDLAKERIRERLMRVPEGIGIALIAYDQRPEVLLPRSRQRRELLSRLDAVETRPMAGRAPLALETAGLIAGLEPPSVIWHVSDETHEASAEGPLVRRLNVALDEVSNTGITAVQVRPVPLEYARYDVFVRIALNRAAPGPVKSWLNATVGGIPNQRREIELEPGRETSLTFRINGSRDQILTLSLEPERDDFPLDDIVSLPLPEMRPILAAWIRPDESEDPYTRLALSALQESGSFELLKGSPEAWPLSEPVDVVIFDGWLPEAWPTSTPAVVIHPPDRQTPFAVRRLAAAVPHEGVRTGNADHPVLFRVSSGRVAISQTAVYDPRGTLEPLWFVGDDAVLSAGEIGGNRVVLMGFSPGLSERLPLTASFPLLMGNALFWCVEPGGNGGHIALSHTGDLVSIEGSSITWSEAGDRVAGGDRRALGGGPVEMDRAGIWTADDGRRGAAYLLSSSESDLQAKGDAAPDDAAYFEQKERFAGAFNYGLLLGIGLLLLLESWLFHRHAVY